MGVNENTLDNRRAAQMGDHITHGVIASSMSFIGGGPATFVETDAAALTAETTVIGRELAAAPAAVSGEATSAGGTIYRSGGTSPSNLTPRVSDGGTLSLRSSLTSAADGSQTLRPGQVSGYDVNMIQQKGGVVNFDAQPAGHVSVSDISASDLKQCFTCKAEIPK